MGCEMREETQGKSQTSKEQNMIYKRQERVNYRA